MKRIICFFIVLLLLLCGCTQNNAAEENAGSTKNENVNDAVCAEDEGGNDDVFKENESGNDYVFTINENGNLVSDSGVEYAHLANEGILYYLGELEFLGSIKGEEKTSQHMGISYQTGMFAIKNDKSRNVLIRRAPNNEWFSIYRKTSLPEFDFSADNCIRFELVVGTGNTQKDAAHTTCGEGISDQAVITAFLSEIRTQKSPREAGLYDMIKQPNGMLENCYRYGSVYGFYEEEPNIVIRMPVNSFNDLAYSVAIEEKEYVLPEEWLQKLLSP